MRATVDRSSPVPLFRQIIDILKAEIETAEDTESLQLTERELMSRFQVSRAPIRQALKELTDAGYLYRQRGQGTFPVRGLQLRQDALKLGGLTRYLKDQGLETDSEIEKIGRIHPPDEIQNRLGISPGKDVYYISRVIKTGGKPLIWSRIYLDVAAPFDPTEPEVEEAGSVFDLLKPDPSVALTQGEHTVYAAWASHDDAQKLDIQDGDPILVMETTMYTREGKLIGFRRLVHRAIDYKIVFTVTG